VSDVCIKIAATMSGVLIVIGSVGMILFATKFPFSTRIRDLELSPERLLGMNGYQVWKYAWVSIVLGAVGQALVPWLK